ncbi:dienelactone hydrolase family protein [Acinetobacter sp. MD2(2019)]|uniref:dienelactone hydrolase family protein n=1 Tax=Acinetobacter sp. MD2(2019) TaxID=2605273 RepID=UPI002D1EA086|nr:dienelactone hydrolase family protein [Acinetobacter sp. MD2(2019)]MEB3754483.1 dienelactone hydrolase family protein [Acinetobacter sp. MD2(2019)]
MSHAIITREIGYTTADGTHCVGFFAAPKSDAPVAGILVGPEWWGPNEYVLQRATELAEHGYAAFAMDMYGDKKSTELASQASEWMNETFAQPNTLVARAQAAFNSLAEQPEVDPKRIAGVGFCYGGKVLLDLARSGADIKAVAAFHAALGTQTPAKVGQVHAELLVLHGADDSMVSLDDVAQFEQEMSQAQVKHHVHILAHAKHGFTNPLADQRAKANNIDLAYNAEAEKTGMAEMYRLFKEKLA